MEKQWNENIHIIFIAVESVIIRHWYGEVFQKFESTTSKGVLLNSYVDKAQNIYEVYTPNKKLFELYLH